MPVSEQIRSQRDGEVIWQWSDAAPPGYCRWDGSEPLPDKAFEGLRILIGDHVWTFVEIRNQQSFPVALAVESCSPAPGVWRRIGEEVIAFEECKDNHGGFLLRLRALGSPEKYDVHPFGWRVEYIDE